jgi:hypothetical protein
LVDPRIAHPLHWIVNRQLTLAVVFGVSGIVLMQYAIEKSKIKSASVLVCTLLILSALSKEYGLAFLGFVVVLGFFLHRKHLKIILMIAIFAIITYFGLRFGLARVSSSVDYCEEIGFKDNSLELCYNDYEPNIRKNFYLWNIGASFVGTFLPDLFSDVGQWVGIEFSPNILILPGSDVSVTEIVFGILIILLVILSFIKFPKFSVSFLSLVIFNAILNFLLYRPRNLFIGMVGVYGLIGIGIYYIQRMYLNKTKLGIIIFWGLIFILGATASLKAESLSHNLRTTAIEYSIQDPCEAAFVHPHPEMFDMELIKDLKIKYKMSNPECQLGGWKTWRIKGLDITK